MADVKMNKRDYFMMLKDMVVASDVDHKDELVDFIDKQVASIDNKAAKQKEKAAATKAAGDELRAAVFAAVTDELRLIDDIMADVVFDDELTKAKVTARLSQLEKNGDIVKDTIKQGSRRLVAYKLA